MVEIWEIQSNFKESNSTTTSKNSFCLTEDALKIQEISRSNTLTGQKQQADVETHIIGT